MTTQPAKQAIPTRLTPGHRQQPSRVLTAWDKLSRVPAGGLIFSAIFARKTPYVASIQPRFTLVAPNRAELLVRRRRKVLNHIGTVHATALCTGLETVAGALAEATIPSGKRWIPKGMRVEYGAMARGDVWCIATSQAEQWESANGELEVDVRGTLRDGTQVISGRITLWVTDRV